MSLVSSCSIYTYATTVLSGFVVPCPCLTLFDTWPILMLYCLFTLLCLLEYFSSIQCFPSLPLLSPSPAIPFQHFISFHFIHSLVPNFINIPIVPFYTLLASQIILHPALYDNSVPYTRLVSWYTSLHLHHLHPRIPHILVRYTRSFYTCFFPFSPCFLSNPQLHKSSRAENVYHYFSLLCWRLVYKIAKEPGDEEED